MLIVICNPGIVNPGPVSNSRPSGSTLNVIFQNVQGLIPFGELSNENPMLDITKCLELSAYLNESKIDIAILNETWFKTLFLIVNSCPPMNIKYLGWIDH